MIHFIRNRSVNGLIQLLCLESTVWRRGELKEGGKVVWLGEGNLGLEGGWLGFARVDWLGWDKVLDCLAWVG